MTSFMLSLWRWLLSWFRKRAGSNGGFRALWGLLQQLFSSFACRRANVSSDTCSPTIIQGTVPPKYTWDPHNDRNDDGYTIIMASHPPPLLNPTNSNEFGLPAIREDAVIRSRAPSPSSVLSVDRTSDIFNPFSEGHTYLPSCRKSQIPPHPIQP
jgi:hypothetical protein